MKVRRSMLFVGRSMFDVTVWSLEFGLWLPRHEPERRSPTRRDPSSHALKRILEDLESRL